MYNVDIILGGIRPAVLYSHIDLQVNNGVLLYYTGTRHTCV